MISIIVCSAVSSLRDALALNIQKTIGVPFELLIEDNTEAQGICKVYNRLVNKAQYDIVCFVHEDVSFMTLDWGKNIVNILEQKEDIGLIGPAGSHFFGHPPIGWFSLPCKEGYYNQGFKDPQQPTSPTSTFDATISAVQIKEIVVSDGFLLITRKKVFEKISFDETNLKKFHGYDVDFSLQIRSLGYKVVVTNQILCTHFSEGTVNEDWHSSMNIIAEKWNKHLPQYIQTLSPAEIVKWKIESCYYWLFYNSSSIPLVKKYFRFFGYLRKHEVLNIFIAEFISKRLKEMKNRLFFVQEKSATNGIQ